MPSMLIRRCQINNVRFKYFIYVRNSWRINYNIISGNRRCSSCDIYATFTRLYVQVQTRYVRISRFDKRCPALITIVRYRTVRYRTVLYRIPLGQLRYIYGTEPVLYLLPYNATFGVIYVMLFFSSLFLKLFIIQIRKFIRNIFHHTVYVKLL